MRNGSSSIWRRIRACRSPPACTGSASCRHVSSPTTTPQPSRRRRKQNAFFGCRQPSSSGRNTISTLRWRGPRSARRPPLRSEPATARPWPPTTASSRSGPRTARKTSRAAPRCSARRSRASNGRELDAERLYEQAIRSARDNGLVHNEAIASELRSALLRGAWL